MREFYARCIFILLDIFIIFCAIFLAFITRNFLLATDSYPLSHCSTFYPLYTVTIALLAYAGIYHHRYDFWHESRVILKGLFFSFIIILAYLALTQSVQEYSRAIISISFLYMAFLLPLGKDLSKKLLFRLGLWQREANIYGDDSSLYAEIFNNHYLGYIESKIEIAKTVFIHSQTQNLAKIKQQINNQIAQSHEVIFIPLMDEYDLTHSHVYNLSNTRTNLIVFQNRLKSKYRLCLKKISDILLSILVFPFISPLLLYIAYKIKKEEPHASVLFKQERLGKNGKIFICYKFRTMYEQSEHKLKNYLKKYPEEIRYYETFHKYQKDPRITKIGHFLRKTSLDELPQIFNVFKNQMSFIGPRPYMLNEEEKIGKHTQTILTVKPGITGLWQVSGRNEVDFYSRVALDTWYIRNWNLWMDMVILFKTVKTVLVREGAS